MYGAKIKEIFEGKPAVIQYSNKVANDRLEVLLADLSGSKTQLIELFENSRTRMSWIENPTTRRQMRWILMERLIDCDEWTLAMSILPEVEQLASIEQLDRLAIAALRHKDIELQHKLDQRLQKLALNEPTKINYLLSSVQRESESARILNNPDQTMSALAILENPLVQSRLTDPRDAAQAAALLMKRADKSEVKAPILQKVRNILQAANWPSCPATAELIIEEATSTLTENPVLNDATLREVENKLLKSRDAMFTGAEKPELLMQCYILLGEARFRLNDYPGASEALSMAEALAEGSGALNEELKIKLTRMRAKADATRGAIDEAMIAYRYLCTLNDNDEELLTSLLFMAEYTHGDDQMDFLKRAWEVMEKSKKIPNSMLTNKEKISLILADIYTEKEEWQEACNWLKLYLDIKTAELPEASSPDMLKLRLRLALANRKAKNDRTALKLFKDMVAVFEGMNEETLDAFKKENSSLYKSILREQSRTYLLLGESYTAKQISKKIGEGLPDKVR